MSGYTKLFNSILASTIWRSDDKTRIVWITLLAMADRDGVAEGSVPGLADFARVSVEDCRRALDVLQAPDEDSRSDDHEGRRIMKVDGGWLILNHAKYRAKANEDERREYLRKKKAESRARRVNTVNKSQQMSIPSTQAEAEADPEDQNQDQEQSLRDNSSRRNGHKVKNSNPKALFIMAKLVLKEFPGEPLSEHSALLKERAARAGIEYDAGLIAKALESAEHQGRARK